MPASFWIDHLWYFISMLLLLIGSAFFSGSETALFNLSPAQVVDISNTHRAGKIAARLLNNPTSLLNTLLLGNLIINVSYTTLAAKVVLDLNDPAYSKWSIPVISIGALLLLILISEVTPKILALGISKGWAMFASPIMAVMQRALSPVVWILHHIAVSPLSRLVAPGKPHPQNITAAELSALLDLVSSHGTLDRDATTIIKEIVDLTDIKTSDIMVPRVDMVCFDINCPRNELGELFNSTGLRKIPVFDGHLDNIIGLVHAKTYLLNPDDDLRKLAAKPTFVPQSANLEKLLIHFRVNKTQSAIVVDEFGGTAGLVTLEDVVEEIIGEIPDPRKTSHEGEVVKISSDEFVIDGNLGIHEWVEAFGIELSTKRISTIGGFVTSQLGKIASVGDEVVYRNLKFTVASMRTRRIGRLDVKLIGGEQ